ncbi:MAG: carbohydrate ABC transporter substrate-binding protein, partial [Betaproteobacteria bacterium]|nr:carbohydrate ABC transporter substrate-binding protein [Betaproteobacteria bacterium]
MNNHYKNLFYSLNIWILALTVPFVLAFTSYVMAADKLVIMSHRVHQDSATTGPGGDVTASWRKANNTDVEWITLGIDPLRERLFRELSLGETSVNIGFILNAQATPIIAKRMMPLNDYLTKSPISDFAGISPSMTKAMTFDGKIYAIPYRHATQGLHYNEAYFKERGIEHAPKTIEELIGIAKKLTYVKADGNKVHGLVLGAYS